jgi:SAM-dependent methyltransferase
MSTDIEWEKWGRQDPYYGVLTVDRFRASRIDEVARAEFFASGQWHVDSVLQSCRQYIDPLFAPRRVLDFGCGVGRLVIPFAAVADKVVGVDVSESMLAEARKNCSERGLTNVSLVGSDDALSEVTESFDLVHSAIVLQHIEVPRGRRLFQRLIECIAPGGAGAVQLTYAKACYPDSFGQPPEPSLDSAAGSSIDAATGGLSRLRRWRSRAVEVPAEAVGRPSDPEMQMNPYNLSELAFLLQTAGIARFHSEFTDHGGELGVFLFFQKPRQATAEES